MTKPELGRLMLARAFEAGVPGAWVVGDSVHGSDHALRRFVERQGRGYVLAVTGAQRLGSKPVADRLEDVPAEAWQRLSAAAGAKGPRPYDRAHLPPHPDAAPGWRKGLLIRREIAGPDEVASSLTLSPAAMALPELVRVAGTRWAVEARSGETRRVSPEGEVGLDHSEVRSWTGRHRHVTPAVPAHAYLAVVREAATGGPGAVDPEAALRPHTVPEVRRLLWRLVWARPPDAARVIAWSAWRRRHRQRARRCHRRRRTEAREPRL